MTPSFQGHLQLLDWSETKRGMKVVFEVMQNPDDPHDANPFRVFTTRDGKTAGQIFGAVLVQVNPETGDTVDPPAKKQTRSQLAYLLCRDVDFWSFVNSHLATAPICESEATCTGWMYDYFGVESRGDLDRFDQARSAFDTLVREFEMWRNDEYRARVR
jgi:hypothetical protein